MLITKIRKLFNEALAGETLTLSEMLPHLDAAIDAINENMNTIYPVFSDLDTSQPEAVYNYFPDSYIRTVVIPGAAWHFYVTDEEGAQTAIQYQTDFEMGKFRMLRDMLYKIPTQYQADSEQGSVIAPLSNDTLGYRGLVFDSETI